MSARKTTAAIRPAALALAAILATAGTAAAGAPATAVPRSTVDGGGLTELRRPFAMPGFKEQDFNGALFVGEGETRFALRVDLLTKTGKVIRENMVPNIHRIGANSPDGSYYEIEVSTDDRTITPEKLGALREVLANPDDWTPEQVTAAKEQLPTFQQQYDQIQRDERVVRIRYARTGGGALIGSVTALHDDTTVFLETASPWGEQGSFRLDNGGVTASSPGVVDPSRTGHFRLTPTTPASSAGAYASVPDLVNAMTGKPAATGTAAAALRYDLRKNQTVTFTAQVADTPVANAPRPAGSIIRDLDNARNRLATSQLRGTGPAGRAITAMRDAIALNSNYDEVHRRSFVMWGLGGGGDWIFTGWDSGWDAITAAAVDPALALDHERDLFDNGGPRYDQSNAGAMHAYAVWRLYRDFGDRALVEQAYPVLAAFFDRLVEWDVDRDGLLESPYGGDRIGGRGNHLGLDDSPQYANYQRIPKTGGSGDPRDNTNLTDVALNSYYALFAESLGNMAAVLGKPVDQQRFTRVRDAVRDGMNTRLWNEERGLYLNRYLDGSWNPVVTPTVFYPMFGGVATPERAAVLVREHLLDPAEFWGEYVIPSVSRDDPTYCGQGSVHESSEHYRYFQSWGEENACEEWKGAAWPPMNATVYDGLKRYGFDTEAAEVATKSTDMWLDSWDKEGWFPEYFDQEPGQSINASATDTAWRTYSWSNLMPLMSTHELIADEPWSTSAGFRFGTLGLPGTNTVRDVWLRGHRYEVTAGPRLTRLVQDGRTVFEARGARVVVRDFVLTDTGASFRITAQGPVTLTVSPQPNVVPRQATASAGSTLVQL